jgi:hypothetical protein
VARPAAAKEATAAGENMGWGAADFGGGGVVGVGGRFASLWTAH